MTHVLATCIHEVREVRDDRPAILVRDHRHFAIHFGALRVVEFGLGLTQQLIEARVLPAAFVPRRVILIGQGVHNVRRRTRTPCDHDEGLGEPDIGPVSIVRLTHNVDRDPGCLRVLREQHGGVHSTRGDRVRRGEVDLQVFDTGIGQKLTCFVRIIGRLRDVIGPIRHRGRVMEVVAHRGRAEGDLFNELFAVDRVLERLTHGQVIKRRRIHMHRHRDRLSRRHVVNLHIGVTGQKRHRLVLDQRHGVCIAGQQSCLTCVRVVDDGVDDFVKVGAFAVPVIVTDKTRTHAEFVLNQTVRATAVAGCPVDGAIGLCLEDR